QDIHAVRDRILPEGAADVAHQAIREARGSGLARRLRRQPAVVGNDGRGVTRRRRRGQECRVGRGLLDPPSSVSLPIRNSSTSHLVLPSIARSTAISPTTPQNLKPCPENPAATITFFA